MKKILLILISVFAVSVSFAQSKLVGPLFISNSTTTQTGTALFLVNTSTGLTGFRKIQAGDIQGLSTSGGVNYTAGSGISITGGNVIINTAQGGSSSQATTLTGINGSTVTGSGFSYTVNSQNLTAGNNITIAGGVINASNPTAQTNIVAGNNITVSGGFPNFTVSSGGGSQAYYTSITGINVTVLGSGALAQTIIGQNLIAGNNITITGNSITGLAQNIYIAGSGISISGSNQIVNTSQNQVTTIIGKNITVSGVYPKFTLTGFNGNNYLPLSAGSSYPLQNDLYTQNIVTGNSTYITNTSTNPRINLNDTQIDMYSSNAPISGTKISDLSLVSDTGSSQFLVQDYTNGLQETGILLNYNKLYIHSNVATFTGVIYESDFSSNYKARSLIDKGYLDTRLSTISGGTIYTGSRIVTVTGSVISAFAPTLTGLGSVSVTNSYPNYTVSGNGITTVIGISPVQVNLVGNSLTITSSALTQAVSLTGVNNTITGSYPSLTVTGNNSFNQNGNSFNAIGELGTNDSYPLRLKTNGSYRLSIDEFGNSSFMQGAITAGIPNFLNFAGGSLTSLTGTAEVSDVYFNLNRPVQWQTGAITLQRAFRVAAPVYSFIGASTIHTAATFAITGNPVADINATISNPLSLLVENGAAEFTDITSNTDRNLIASRYATDASASVFSFKKSRGTRSVPTILSSGDYIGAMLGRGYTGTQYLSSAQIRFQVNGSISASSLPQDITFNTDATGALTERMSILAAGGINLGLTRSNIFRDTNAGSDVTLPFLVDPNSAVTDATNVSMGVGSGGAFNFFKSNGTRRIRVAGFRGVGPVNTPGAETGQLVFTTKPAGSSITDRLTIDENGSVIVNTAALSTTATDGFLYITSSAGPPTGTPTAYTGRIPVHIDTTNLRIYVYISGTWRYTNLI